MSDAKNQSLIAAIIVAAILVSGALVFLGMRMGLSSDDLKTEIRTGIEDYVKDQEAEYNGTQEPPTVEGDFTDDDAVLGDADAPVTIVEFSEYQCPYCARFYEGAYPEIKEKYVETGKVKIVFRDMPLQFHAGAYPAALAAECVRDQGGDDMYFEMHDALFEDQSVLSGDEESVNEALLGLATDIGVDLDEYNSCVESDKFKEEIEADTADGNSVGITGTPSFIINGEILVGAQPFEAFEAIIEAALAE